MRRFTLLLLLVCLLFGADVAKADKRVALVIGNGAYRTISRLANPPVDAEAMAGVLRDVGFDVVEGTNLTRDEMTGLSLEFARKARGADIAVLFYAGHGVAAGDTDFLLPVDADVKTDSDIKRGAGINVSHMLDRTMRDAKVKLVFLDACRDNPFVTAASSRASTRGGVQSGLAGMEPGTLIAFATGLGQAALDGQKGVNSPFTRALVDHIARPGVEIRQAMTEVRAEVDRETNRRQVPRDQTNLTGAVYLNPVPVLNVTAQASAAAAVSTTGHFSKLALARTAALESGPSATTRNLSGGPDPATFTADATEATEEQIGLSRGQRRDVQRRLTRLGFDTRVTGKFDPSTRAVITRWQEARGYPATGFLNTLQHKALLAEIITTTDANPDSDGKPTRHHRGGGRRHHGGGPLSGPGRFIGGVVGGLFR